jgi:hypothetical protein
MMKLSRRDSFLDVVVVHAMSLDKVFAAQSVLMAAEVRATLGAILARKSMFHKPHEK